MDRRTITALVLMALVIVITPMLFPSKKQPPRADSTATALGDTARRAAVAQPATPTATPAPTPTVSAAPATPAAAAGAAAPAPARPATVEPVVIATPRAEYT